MNETFIPIEGSNFAVNCNSEKYLKVIAKFEKTHHIQPVWGCDVDLEQLKKNESVCFGEIPFYHFRLTEK